MIRTKIVATLGPACSTVERLLGLLEEGVDVCRLNFSHGDLADHARMLANLRQAADRFGQPVAVLGDLAGPKIRLGKVAEEAGLGGMLVQPGDTLVIQRQPIIGAKGRVSTNYAHFVDDVQVGHRIYVEDGLLRFEVRDKSADELICTCLVGGLLQTAKGVNLPDTSVRIPSITERDWKCVDWAIANKLDYLALSFVRRAEDLRELREYLNKNDGDIHLIAKIEKAEALEQIDAIVQASDGLMVARGDLGVELDVARVPIIQKDLIRRCQAAGKPVIVATQMLQSMIEQSTPTRAEVSDVANAIFDGTDAVMLSGETSVGKHPRLAVGMMNHVAEVTEAYLDQNASPLLPAVQAPDQQVGSAIARGVWQIIHDLKVKLVVVWSRTGTTAQIFSKHRFSVPIVALSDNATVLRRMALHYGVMAKQMALSSEMPAFIEQVDRLLLEQKLADKGDRVILAAGMAMGVPFTINGLVVHAVGESPEGGSSVAPSAALDLEKP